MRPAALCEESWKRGVPQAASYSGNTFCSSRVHKGMSCPDPRDWTWMGPQELAGVAHNHRHKHTWRWLSRRRAVSPWPGDSWIYCFQVSRRVWDKCCWLGKLTVMPGERHDRLRRRGLELAHRHQKPAAGIILNVIVLLSLWKRPYAPGRVTKKMSFYAVYLRAKRAKEKKARDTSSKDTRMAINGHLEMHQQREEMRHCWPVAVSRRPMDANVSYLISYNQIAALVDDRGSATNSINHATDATGHDPGRELRRL